MTEEIIYYDDDGNLVYADPSELFTYSDDSKLVFDNLKSLRKKLDGKEHHHYDEVVFIDKLEKIILNHPFVDIRHFLKDYLGGLSSFKMMKKFGLVSRLENYRIAAVYLGFLGKRTTKYDNNLAENLKNKIWHTKYHNFVKCFSLFQEELDELICYNILRGILILYLFEKKDVIINNDTYKEIKNYAISYYNRIFLIQMTESIKNNFEIYLDSKLKNKFELILNDLESRNILYFHNQIYTITSKFTDIQENILKLLETSPQGITHRNFTYKILRYYSELRLVPMELFWHIFLQPLESTEKIIRKPTQVWQGKPFSDMLFTKQNFENTMNLLRQQLEQFGRVKFFGRQINPDQFIEELIELNKGSFDDVDDQVTRISGLCLADSVLTIGPHEELDEFDFSIDVSNYRFRPEQIEAMNNLNFKLTSPIIHCKVMINKIIDLKNLERLYYLIPSGHQGVIFTLMPLTPSVQKFLSNDTKIQVIDEIGIRSWVKITSTLPCRVGAIVKIRFDPITDLQGKIARIDSVNYETGMTSVTVLPTLEQITIHVRSLQEIQLYEKTPSDFIRHARNYFEFLKLLSRISDPDEFNLGIFETIPNNLHWDGYVATSEFGNIKTKITRGDFMQKRNYFCSCFKYNDNPTKICRHIVSELDALVRNYDNLQTPIQEVPRLYDGIMNFVKYTTTEQIDALLSHLDDEDSNLLKDYLKHIANLKN